MVTFEPWNSSFSDPSTPTRNASPISNSFDCGPYPQTTAFYAANPRGGRCKRA